MAGGVWWRFGAGVLFLWMALAAPVSAERLPPNPLTDGWQVMTSDGKWVSSACLGEMTSPSCVADTALACTAFSAYGWANRGFEKIFADETWIGGYHPLCDPLRVDPGNPGYGPSEYEATGAGSLLFYKVFPLLLYDEILTRHQKRYQEDDIALPVLLFDCVPPPECDFSTEAARPEGEPFNPQCLGSCEFIRIVQALVVRQQDDGSWKVVGGVSHIRNVTWPYLHGYYQGLWMEGYYDGRWKGMAPR